MDGRGDNIGKQHEVKSDAELHAAAIAGGPDAFAPIVDRYKDAVFGIALARVGDFHAAEDIAQNVLLAAFERLGSLKQPSRLGAWLRSMTIHQSIDHARARRPIAEAQYETMAASEQHEPGTCVERNELRERVLAAIGRLSRTQRETTTLFYVNGYSVAEVAAIQEIPVGTVKGRLHDARGKLKEELIGMVENVLKSEAPKEGFGARVLELLRRLLAPEVEARVPWQDVFKELRRIGPQGIEGYVKALESPYSRVRQAAVHASPLSDSPSTRETIIRLMKAGLTDPNKRVRRNAVDVLLQVDVPPERRREFVSLAIPLMQDKSKRVRKRAAYALGRIARDVPLEAAARALADEHDPGVRAFIAELVRGILNARPEEAGTN
jgi:RNA polymerase sigma-70 factor (ECF subfamily)